MSRVGPLIRYLPWASTLPLAALGYVVTPWISLLALALFGLGVQDILQPHHAVRRNYPLTGRLR